MFKLGLEKAGGLEIKTNIHWITEKESVPEKHLLLFY